jgi:hypothetical protein
MGHLNNIAQHIVNLEDEQIRLNKLLDLAGVAKGETLLERIGLLLQRESYSIKDFAELEKDMVQLLKNIGDMHYFLIQDSGRIFDKKFPWNVINPVVWAAADIRHKYYSHINTWDLTNDPERRKRILSALGRDEQGNKLPEEQMDDGL